jgi:transaldolase
LAKPAAFSVSRAALAARAASGNAPASFVGGTGHLCLLLLVNHGVRLLILDSLSLGVEFVSELDSVAGFSEIVPDTVVFDDFEK